MAVIKKVKGVGPKFGEDNFIADNATIVGDVETGKHCSFWFNSVVRGDVHKIIMGDYVNVQDGAIVHCTYETAPTTIGNRVSIAHNAIVHGCTIKDKCLNRHGSNRNGRSGGGKQHYNCRRCRCVGEYSLRSGLCLCRKTCKES